MGNVSCGERIYCVSETVQSDQLLTGGFQYGLTCPLGQAIGLALRTTYDPEGEMALLVVGVANAISVSRSRVLGQPLLT